VERLFSRAKIIMSDRRQSMTPYHLELLLVLCMNKDLWDAREIQAILDHEVEGEEDDDMVEIVENPEADEAPFEGDIDHDIHDDDIEEADP
jgi:hypothetical protein